MNKSRRNCCIDANILLDFIAGDIVDTLFLLPFDFLTSDIVVVEISRSYSDIQLKQMGLNILELDEATVLEMFSFKQQHIDLSIEDISIYFLSLKYKAIIISGDGPLRTLADTSLVEYHGTLWLLEELVQQGILSPRDAAEALRTMLSNKRWLPRAESEKLIKKWESGE
jgi:hypothetical protein